MKQLLDIVTPLSSIFSTFFSNMKLVIIANRFPAITYGLKVTYLMTYFELFDLDEAYA
jgi:hypothetical protein